MIGGFRDYIILLYGAAISLVTAILAVAINAAYGIYFKKYPLLLIFLCIIIIIVLFKGFKKTIGLKLNEKELNGHKLAKNLTKFKKEIKKEHPDLNIIYNICSLKGKLIYNITNPILLISFIMVFVFIAFVIIYIFFWAVYILYPREITFKMPEEVIGIVGVFIMTPFLLRFGSTIESLEEWWIKKFRHTTEFTWDHHFFQLNPKECHVILDSHKNQILIKYFEENECLKVENIIRKLGLTHNNDMMYI